MPIHKIFPQLLTFVLVPCLIADPTLAAALSQHQSFAGQSRSNLFLQEALNPRFATADFHPDAIGERTVRFHNHHEIAASRGIGLPTASAVDQPSGVPNDKQPTLEQHRQTSLVQENNRPNSAVALLTPPVSSGNATNNLLHSRELTFEKFHFLVPQDQQLPSGWDSVVEKALKIVLMRADPQSAPILETGALTIEIAPDLHDQHGQQVWVQSNGPQRTILIHATVIHAVIDLNAKSPHAGDAFLSVLIQTGFSYFVQHPTELISHINDTQNEWVYRIEMATQFVGDMQQWFAVLEESNIIPRRAASESTEMLYLNFENRAIITRIILRNGFLNHFALLRLMGSEKDTSVPTLDSLQNQTRLMSYLDAISGPTPPSVTDPVHKTIVDILVKGLIESKESDSMGKLTGQYFAIILDVIYAYLDPVNRAQLLHAMLVTVQSHPDVRIKEAFVRFVTTSTAREEGAVMPLDLLLDSGELANDLPAFISVAKEGGWSNIGDYLDQYQRLRKKNFLLSGTVFGLSSDWTQYPKPITDAIEESIHRLPPAWISAYPVAINLRSTMNEADLSNQGFAVNNVPCIILPTHMNMQTLQHTFWHEYLGHIIVNKTFDILEFMWVLNNHGWRLHFMDRDEVVKVGKDASGRLFWEVTHADGHVEIKNDPRAYSLKDIQSTYYIGADFIDPITGQAVNYAAPEQVPQTWPIDPLAKYSQSRGAELPLGRPIHYLSQFSWKNENYRYTHPLEEIAEAVALMWDSQARKDSLDARKKVRAYIYSVTHGPQAQIPENINREDVLLNMFIYARFMISRDENGTAIVHKHLPFTAEQILKVNPDATYDPETDTWALPMSKEESSKLTIYEQFRKENPPLPLLVVSNLTGVVPRPEGITDYFSRSAASSSIFAPWLHGNLLAIARSAVFVFLAGVMMPVLYLLHAQPKPKPTGEVEISVSGQRLLIKGPLVTSSGMKVIVPPNTKDHDMETLKVALDVVRDYAEKSPTAPANLKGLLQDGSKGALIIVSKPDDVYKSFGITDYASHYRDSDAAVVMANVDGQTQALKTVLIAVDPSALTSSAKTVAAVGHEFVGHVTALDASEGDAFTQSVMLLEWIGRVGNPELSSADLSDIRGPLLQKEKAFQANNETSDRHQEPTSTSATETAHSNWMTWLWGLLPAAAGGALWLYRFFSNDRRRAANHIVPAAYDAATEKQGSFNQLPTETKKLLIRSYIKDGPILPLPDIGLDPTQRQTYKRRLEKLDRKGKINLSGSHEGWMMIPLRYASKTIGVTVAMSLLVNTLHLSYVSGLVITLLASAISFVIEQRWGSFNVIRGRHQKSIISNFEGTPSLRSTDLQRIIANGMPIRLTFVRIMVAVGLAVGLGDSLAPKADAQTSDPKARPKAHDRIKDFGAAQLLDIAAGTRIPLWFHVDPDIKALLHKNFRFTVGEQGPVGPFSVDYAGSPILGWTASGPESYSKSFGIQYPDSDEFWAYLPGGLVLIGKGEPGKDFQLKRFTPPASASTGQPERVEHPQPDPGTYQLYGRRMIIREKEITFKIFSVDVRFVLDKNGRDFGAESDPADWWQKMYYQQSAVDMMESALADSDFTATPAQRALARKFIDSLKEDIAAPEPHAPAVSPADAQEMRTILEAAIVSDPTLRQPIGKFSNSSQATDGTYDLIYDGEHILHLSPTLPQGGRQVIFIANTKLYRLDFKDHKVLFRAPGMNFEFELRDGKAIVKKTATRASLFAPAHFDFGVKFENPLHFLLGHPKQPNALLVAA